MSELRLELQKICEWIKPGSRVLDLGCGDGALLAWLQENSDVTGYGIEISPSKVLSCLEKGVNIIQADLDAGLTDFDDKSFDYVVMTQALQALQYPHRTITEMLRVGEQSIVTFPNFGLWRHRLQLGIGGKMPVSKALPSEWYETQNIHLCTVTDFERFCQQRDINVLQRDIVDYEHKAAWLMRTWPNLFGELALYQINAKK
jgi:methionine biosynthesis protein MetW